MEGQAGARQECQAGAADSGGKKNGKVKTSAQGRWSDREMGSSKSAVLRSVCQIFGRLR